MSYSTDCKWNCRLCYNYCDPFDGKQLTCLRHNHFVIGRYLHGKVKVGKVKVGKVKVGKVKVGKVKVGKVKVGKVKVVTEPKLFILLQRLQIICVAYLHSMGRPHKQPPRAMVSPS